MDYRKKNLYRRLLYSPVALGLLLTLVIFAGKAVFNAYGKYRLASNALVDSNNEYSALVSRSDFLNSEIKKLDTTRGQESILRERYSVAKEGEKMVIIVNEKISSSGIPVVEGGIWHKFLELFN